MRTIPTTWPRWVSANDSIPQVYVNYRFNPAVKGLTFPKPYASGYLPYADAASMATLETQINEALVKRFHPDEEKPYPGIKELKADTVKLDGEAKIWYIGRFLDGFIFDTNIDEVKQIIYGEVASEGKAFEYTRKREAPLRRGTIRFPTCSTDSGPRSSPPLRTATARPAVRAVRPRAAAAIRRLIGTISTI